MIIWSRWGILVFPFIGLGVGLGFALQALFGFGGSDTGAGFFVGLGLLLSSIGLYFFVQHAMLRGLDKPRPAFMVQRLAQPYVHPNGVRQTHQQLPVLNPQTGEQVWTQPTSSLFFVPVRYWPYVLAGIGVVALVAGVIGLLTGPS